MVVVNTDDKATAYAELFQTVKAFAESFPEPGTKDMTPHNLRVIDHAVHELGKAWRRLKAAHGFTTTGRKRFPLSPGQARELVGRGVPVARIARDYGLSRTTVYKLLNTDVPS